MTPVEKAALNGFIPGSNAPWSNPSSFEPEPEQPHHKGLNRLAALVLLSWVIILAVLRLVL